MKRISSRLNILTVALATFLLTSLSSCDKDFFYEAKITVITLDGTLVPGATVEPYQGVINPDPSDPTSLPNDLDPDRYTKVTGADGTVFYEFDNEVQIPLKVYIESINGDGPYEGVGEIKVEEDETVKRTITIYKTS